MARWNRGLLGRLPAGRQGQAGISLVSVLIALALLATVAVAVSRLIVTGSAGSRITRENFVAIQIAREGLELIRTVRDNNWFATPPIDWRTNLCENAPEVIFDAVRARNNDPLLKTTATAPENKLARRQADGELVHDLSETNQTIYSRIININCDDPTFIEVTSRVEWTARSTSHSLDIKERFYNWLPLL